MIRKACLVWLALAATAVAQVEDLCTQQDATRLLMLDDASGTTATDDFGANGTYVGSPTLGADGPHGTTDAVTLTATGQYINAGTNWPLGDYGATFSCWFKVGATTVATPRRLDLIGSLDNIDLNIRVNHDGTSTSAGYLYLRTNDGANQQTAKVSVDSGVNDGNWHHMTVMFTKNVIPKLWIDGVPTSVDSVLSSGTVDWAALDFDLYIGDLNNAGSRLGNWFDGSIAQVAWFPWRLGSDAITQLASTSPDAVTINPTLAAPYISSNPSTHTATRFAANLSGGRRVGLGVYTGDDHDTDSVDFDHGAGATTKTLSESNLFNTEGSYYENGVIDDVAAGEQTVVIEANTTDVNFEGYIVRSADAESQTIIEAGSSTHCSPQVCRVGNVVTSVGAELYDGARRAWQSTGDSQQVFSAIASDKEERYHHGTSVVSVNGNLVFIQVGHNRPYVRIKSCTGTDMSTLSSETQLGTASDDLTYCYAAVRADGKVVVLTRDTFSTKGLVLFTISDPLGSPTATKDYIVGGDDYYPRGVQTIGNDVFIAFQLRPTASSWRGWYAARYVDSESEWYACDGVTDGADSLGTAGIPRFGTLTDLEILADPTGGGVQKYMGESCAFWDGGSNSTNLAAVFAETSTTSVSTYATTTMKLAGYVGSTDTMTETAIPNMLTANSFRQSGIVQADGSGAFVAVTDRGSYLPTNVDDEDALYYNGWGGGVIREYTVTSPTSASPSFTAGSVRSAEGQLAGWMAPVGNGQPGEYSYQSLYEGLTATRAQGVVELSPLSRPTLYPIFGGVVR